MKKNNFINLIATILIALPLIFAFGGKVKKSNY